LGDLDAQPRTHHLAMTNQLWNDLIDLIDRNGEADARRAAGRADDRRGHADEPAGAVEQGPAGIAGVDRGAGLNRPLDRAAALGFDLPPQGADNAVGHRLVQAERIAD